MKTKLIKKVIASALAATMVLGISLTAFATTEAATASNDAPYEGETVVEAVEAPQVVAGIKSTISGINYATAVNGAAIETAAANIAAGYGLTGNEKPFAKFYNFDAKKSTAAASVVNAVAASIGATVGPIVNVELGKMSGGKYSLLSQEGAPITMAFGIPARFATAGATYAVIRVTSTSVEVLQDLDTNPNTVTFNTTGGRGVYAIVKY